MKITIYEKTWKIEKKNRCKTRKQRKRPFKIYIKTTLYVT